MTIKGISGTSGIPEDSNGKGSKFSPEQIQDAVRSYIKDRLGNAANVLPLKDPEITQRVLTSLKAFINTVNGAETKYYFYDGGTSGNALYMSSKEFDASSLGDKNQAYIAIKDRVTPLTKTEVEKAVDLKKVQTKLGQIKSQIEAESIDLQKIGEITDERFAAEQIAAKNS
jgi:hypothetical protein